jgi:curved DNA-binding protein
MSKRDYYDVLSVSKGATQDEIKRAYRKLAREHHPDVSKAPDAAKKFAEIQEAYDTLSDEAKRRQYDQFGFDGSRSSAHARAGTRYDEWPNATSGAAGTPFEGEDLGSVFDAIFGERSRGSARSRRSPFADADEAEPEVIRHAVTIPFETAWKGGMAPVRVEEAGKGKTRTIEVQIPPGIADGTQLRVRGAGTAKRGAPDLLLQIRVLPHALFRRGEFEETGKGLDLFLDLPISIAEATLGGSVTIPTLSGSLDLVIPPGTASGKKLRLKGQGLHDQAGNRGDLYALTKIIPPAGTDLNDDDRKALERLALKGVSLRTGPLWGGKR